MIDDYHCSFQHARVRDPFWDKGSELDALAATILARRASLLRRKRDEFIVPPSRRTL
jgi:hypothetical protein